MKLGRRLVFIGGILGASVFWKSFEEENKTLTKLREDERFLENELAKIQGNNSLLNRKDI